MKIIFLIFFLFITLPANAIEKRAWDIPNRPGQIIKGLIQYNLSRLPKKGHTKKRLWSGYSWPDRLGGVANRWSVLGETESNPHRYSLYSAKEISSLPQAKLDALSPAEKYDIFMGRFDYPTVKSEIKRTSPSSPKWYGLCHAFALASAHYKEPSPKGFKIEDSRFPNDQIQLNFFSSDIKALLAISIDRQLEDFDFLGRRCESGILSESGACWDVNPASLHLVLTNWIGLKKRTVIMDFSKGKEVWNFPVLKFSSSYSKMEKISPKAAPGTLEQFRVYTEVYKTVGNKPNRGVIGNKSTLTTYNYTLEVDKYGDIIGGEWIDDLRPDFIWYMKRPHFTDYLADLVELVD